MLVPIEHGPGARRRPRFRIWILFVPALAAAVAGPLAWGRVRRAEAQRGAVARLTRADVWLEYDYQAPSESLEPGDSPPTHPPGPKWLRDLLGPEYFREVRGVGFRFSANADQVATLAAFDRLVSLQVALRPDAAGTFVDLPEFPLLESATVGGPGMADAALARLAGPGKLRQLSIDRAELTDAGLGPIGKLARLRALDLTRMPGLSDLGVAPVLANLPPLKRLNLSQTGVGDASLAPLAGWPGIESLNLHRTRITDRTLALLPGCREVAWLNLGATAITDAGLASLGELTRLESLDLGWTATTDLGLARLAGLTGLERLELTNTAVTDAGLVHLAGMHRLRALSLPAAITDAGLDRLVGLASLERLDIPGGRITDAGLARLRPLGRLARLQVTETLITAAGIEAAQAAMPALRRVIHESSPPARLSRPPTPLRAD